MSSLALQLAPLTRLSTHGTASGKIKTPTLYPHVPVKPVEEIVETCLELVGDAPMLHDMLAELLRVYPITNGFDVNLLTSSELEALSKRIKNVVKHLHVLESHKSMWFVVETMMRCYKINTIRDVPIYVANVMLVYYAKDAKTFKNFLDLISVDIISDDALWSNFKHFKSKKKQQQQPPVSHNCIIYKYNTSHCVTKLVLGLLKDYSAFYNAKVSSSSSSSAVENVQNVVSYCCNTLMLIIASTSKKKDKSTVNQLMSLLLQTFDELVHKDNRLQSSVLTCYVLMLELVRGNDNLSAEAVHKICSIALSSVEFNSDKLNREDMDSFKDAFYFVLTVIELSSQYKAGGTDESDDLVTQLVGNDYFKTAMLSHYEPATSDDGAVGGAAVSLHKFWLSYKSLIVSNLKSSSSSGSSLDPSTDLKFSSLKPLYDHFVDEDFAVDIISAYLKSAEPTLAPYSSVLKLVHKFHEGIFDASVKRVIENYSDGNSGECDDVNSSKINELISSVYSIVPSSSSSAKDGGSYAEIPVASLSSSKPQIRMASIENIKESLLPSKSKTKTKSKSKSKSSKAAALLTPTSGQLTLINTLLHMFLTDPDASVAHSSGKSYLELSESYKLSPSADTCEKILDKHTLAYESDLNRDTLAKLKDMDKQSKSGRSRSDKKAPSSSSSQSSLYKKELAVLSMLNATALSVSLLVEKSEITDGLTERFVSHLDTKIRKGDGSSGESLNIYPYQFIRSLRSPSQDDHLAEETISKIASSFFSSSSSSSSGVSISKYLKSAPPSKYQSLSSRFTYVTISKMPIGKSDLDLLDVIVSVIASAETSAEISLQLAKKFTSEVKELDTNRVVTMTRKLMSSNKAVCDEVIMIAWRAFVPNPASRVLNMMELSTTFHDTDYVKAERCLIMAKDMTEDYLNNSGENVKEDGGRGKGQAKRGGRKKVAVENDAAVDSLLRSVVPALHLLTHPERTTRKKSIIFMESLSEANVDKEGESIVMLAKQASGNFALELEIDPLAMPGFLGKITRKDESLRAKLLRYVERNFLEGFDCSLGQDSVSSVLRAMENSGDGNDDLFPLEERWETCGSAIFYKFMEESDLKWNDKRNSALKSSVRLMRCVAGDGTGNGLGIVDNGSGRVRKYSVSESSFVKPPETLLKAMKDAIGLEGGNIVCRDLVVGVMKKTSWVDNVFANLNSQDKFDFAKLLLLQRVTGVDGSSNLLTAGFENLLLACDDLVKLIEEVDLSKAGSDGEKELLKLVYLCDFIGGSGGKGAIAGGASGGEGYLVFKLLFNMLAVLSKMKEGERGVGGVEFCKGSLVACLVEITGLVDVAGAMECKGDKKKKRRRSSSGGGRKGDAKAAVGGGDKDERAFFSYAELCIALIEGSGGVEAVKASDVVQNILALLTLLTDKCPSIAKMLLSALQLITEGGESIDDVRSFQITSDCLHAIIPSFCKGGDKAGLRLFDLIKCFVGSFDKILVHRRKNFFGSFIRTLTSTRRNSGAIAAVVACLLGNSAGRASDGEEQEKMRSFCLDLIYSSATSEQVREERCLSVCVCVVCVRAHAIRGWGWLRNGDCFPSQLSLLSLFFCFGRQYAEVIPEGAVPY